MRSRGVAASVILLAALSFLSPALSAAASDEEEKKPLTRLSIEELSQLKVVSVSRRSEDNMETPSAIHVITNEDIRRTGATTIPDALRIAPGIQASRIDADEWAVATRGFANRFSRSNLVVVDGRSVWTPLFAGVFWDTQEMFLEDINQIEVSRGPGGPVFGANSKNGVINITTKSARDTHGGLASVALGNAEQNAGVRCGGVVRQDIHYRVFAKYMQRDGTKPLPSIGYDDAEHGGLAGFRLDWGGLDRDSFTLHGNLYDGSAHQPTAIAIFNPPFLINVNGDAAFSGHSLIGRWTRSLQGGGEVTTQAYYDHTSRNERYYREDRDTLDLDVQHRFDWGSNNQFIWGGSYRRSNGTFIGSETARLIPPERADDTAGLFANNEFRLSNERLRVTLGTRLEWNDYAGWNMQPGARLAWTTSRQTFWGSVTRALRTSSRLEQGLVLYTPLSATEPLFSRTMGSTDFKPEGVVALEAGYKVRLPRVLLTASAFRNRYFDLATSVPGPPEIEEGSGTAPRRTVIPVYIRNGSDGRSSGFEGKIVYSPSKKWRLQAAYSLLNLSLDGEAGVTFKSNSPHQQLWLTSFFTPVKKIDIDVVFRSVGAIPGFALPSFNEADTRIAWRPRTGLEFSVVGSNLLHKTHQEFGGGFAIQRAFRADATVSF